MDTVEIHDLILLLLNEVKYSTSRSRGPGGQHVNKVNTKVELRFKIPDSEILTKEQKSALNQNLSTKISSEGVLIITSQASRSQIKNKEIAISKFVAMLEKAFTPPIKRKPTKPTKASKKKRIEVKRKLSEKKGKRRPPEIP